MSKSTCAVDGCASFPIWEIVWSNGRLYDVCDDHARSQSAWPFFARADGSLHELAGVGVSSEQLLGS